MKATKLDIGSFQLRTEGLAALREATLSPVAVSIGPRRTVSPHEYYRYPARFSPDFARAAILAFTNPGDLVLDPFVGGGTTLLEAMRHRRRSIGADLNELATFVTRVKTTVCTDAQLDAVDAWIRALPATLRLGQPVPSLHDDRLAGRLKDLDTRETWRVRTLIAHALRSLDSLDDDVARDFARCILLRVSQWALDMRSEVPTVEEYRRTFITIAGSMVTAARTFTHSLPNRVERPLVLTQATPGLADHPELAGIIPHLILTSPPSPGVYVMYHRWKLKGRREIPAPYWISGANDGMGMASYTMHARADKTQGAYFRQLLTAYKDLRRLAGPKTLLVQIVGFNNVQEQLGRYLGVMTQAGFQEVAVPSLATAPDGRLWRSVPGRRWWATAGTQKMQAPSTATEVALIHRPTP
jgi:hypothetical protein